MPKNPFVTSKSRKKKKSRKNVHNPEALDEAQKPKTLCPRSMVRYANVSGYEAIWTCKICLTTLLSENAVQQHLLKCKKTFEVLESETVEKNSQVTNNVSEYDARQYICRYCDQVFSRMVTLNKHEEQHELSNSSPEYESDIDNKVVWRIKPNRVATKQPKITDAATDNSSSSV
ncbi:uncharacterized protein LOC126843417 [Adelges cooleyi]|uniref:uncharacterized protein LOC126843417 n=1 Tax=Adelges cooleyi TaxID=133065 RepID=UPI00217F263D|nr:uncharacterized protein LOC126843417 [Adelges cooleyi]XP_050436916.1 uncharacterized protein LOC126843417 [Adelges cooleyi]XP_050436917.1 uncharacterized protein LOC126843417 [Adelges cooleyi]